MKPSEIEDLLTPTQTPEPPAGLLEAIQAEIPAELPGVAPSVASSGPGAALAFERRRRYRRVLLAAASLAVALLGGFLTWRVSQDLSLVPAQPPGREQSQQRVEQKSRQKSSLADQEKGEEPGRSLRQDLSESLSEERSEDRSEELRVVPAPLTRPEVPAQAPAENSPTDSGADRTVAQEGSLAPQASVDSMQASVQPEPEPIHPRAVSPAAPPADRDAASKSRKIPLPDPTPEEPSALRGNERIDPGGNQRGDTFFRGYGVNPFVDTAEDPLSTFALDVDTGSYTVARRYLLDGHLPPRDAIRPEEFVNYFDYGDEPPRGRRPSADFALHAEGAPSPFSPPEGAAAAGTAQRYRLLRLAIRGRDIAVADRVQTLAFDTKAQLELDPEVVERWRLLGYENRDVADERFRDDRVDAGEIGAGHGVTALYELRLAPGAALSGSPSLGTLRLRYRSASSGEIVELERRISGRDLAPSWEAASPSFRLAAVVAEFAEILRGSYWARGGPAGGAGEGTRDPRAAGLRELILRARQVAGEHPGDARVAELASLIRTAVRLLESSPP